MVASRGYVIRELSMKMASPHRFASPWLKSLVLALTALMTPPQSLAQPGPDPPRAAAARMWMAEPIALDADIDSTLLQHLGDAMQTELERSAAVQLLRGPETLLQSGTEAAAVGARLARAGELLRRGEEYYVNFEYGPAAASLAEAAGLYTMTLAELKDEELARLYRARLIEGLAWLEAGQPLAGRLAFTKLATIRPDFEPDPSLMPPHARSAYQQAVGEVMALGTGAVEVRCEPDGATVLVDGVPRGQTPLTIAGLPQGTHGLKVFRPGYAPVLEEVAVTANQTARRDFTLTPVPARLSLDRVRNGAARGTDPGALVEDLALLCRSAGVESLLLVGVARRSNGYVVTALLWQPKLRAAATYRAIDKVELDSAAAELVPALLAASWPAVQLPAERTPLDTDFERSLLGVGPTYGRAETVLADEQPSLWLWGGIGAGALVVIGAIAGGVAYGVYASTKKPEQGPDRAEVVLTF